MSIRTKIITATAASILGTLLLSGVAVAYTGIPDGFTFTKKLNVGSNNQDVVYLKIVLANEGCVSGLTNTTYFGKKTGDAVKCFKAKYGIGSGTTLVSTLTNAKLNQIIGGTTGVVPPTTPTGAGLTVALAADNPASGVLVSSSTARKYSQSGADIAHFTFTNGDNGSVKVTNLKLTRLGVAADSTLVNVYLYNGAQRLTDGASVSSGVITFNDPTGLFTVPAGSSVTIRVLADLEYGAAGQTVGVKINAASDVTSNASSVNGTFPVAGNINSIAAGDLATVDFKGDAPTPTSGTVDPQLDYTVWQNTVQVGTRAVNLTRFVLYQTGSASASDIQNYRLNIDGVNVGSAVAQADANGYITFDLSSSPVTLQTGGRTFKVLADIIGGSSKTFAYAVRTTTDAVFVDSQYGAATTPTYKTGTAFTQRKSCTTSACTINSGSVTIAKATDSPSGNVILGASNVTLAKYILTAFGEPVKITDLYVGITDTTDTEVTKIRNVALYANGVQVGNTQTNFAEGDTTTGTDFTLGSSLIVSPGSPVTLEIRSDIHEGTSGNAIENGHVLTAYILDGSGNAEGTVSKTSISTPSTNVAGNSLTVAVGSLTLSKYLAYTDQAIVPPTNNSKLGHFTLTSSSTEATNLNTIYLDLNNNTSWVTNVYVKYGNVQVGYRTTTSKSTLTAGTTPGTTIPANSYSINYSLAAGATIDVEVYGDVASSAASSIITYVRIDGVTAGSSTSVKTNDATGGVAGQTITIGTGSINAVKDGTTPSHQAVAGGQQVTAAKFKFTASNDTYKITELKFDIATEGNAAAISSLVLKDGSTVLATVPYDSQNNYFNVTGLNVSVAANTTKVLTVDYVLAVPYSDGVGTTAASIQTAGKNLAVILQYMKTLNGSGVMYDAGTGASSTNSSVTIASSTSGTSTANYLYNFKSIPTFTAVTLTGQDTLLGSGSQTSLYSFTVKADTKGDIALKQLKFPITITDNQTTNVARLTAFRFFRGSDDITNTSSGQNAYILNDSDNTDLTSTTSLSSSGTVDVIFYPEEVIPAGETRTYTLKATPTGFDPAISSYSADSVTCYLNTDTTPAGVSAGADVTRYFLNSDSNTAGKAYLYTSSEGKTSGTSSNVIWSDMSAKSHSEEYNAATSDWFNGYLIKSLPLTTFGITAK